ncbi:MAG: methylenetetrahydrofolate dehydrogenase / methenyltetrahydrofolate cyclohydrolase [Desulfovibrionales bacterium]|nr:methylenetetrahydrofolate dehydrogenase / methenyltetrahydrofolate cyclohydrolase [Desulfovibrionales bacterium]
MLIIDGKATALAIRREIAEASRELESQHGRSPGLAVILVGDDPASHVYVRNKERACQEANIRSFSHRLPASVTQQELLDLIDSLADSDDIDGILLQLPLPKGLDEDVCLDRIPPTKDVDGFHPMNVGRMALGLPGLRSCTPAGIMTLLQRHDIDPSGMHAVVLGRSNIVGKPMSLLLLEANATVTICHSRTKNIQDICRQADLLVAAVGRPHFVTGDMVKPGAVVVDVGIHRTDNGLIGDCDFEAMKDKVAAITPVPGGVGPMTIAQLLANTLQACRQRLNG